MKKPQKRTVFVWTDKRMLVKHGVDEAFVEDVVDKLQKKLSIRDGRNDPHWQTADDSLVIEIV